MKKDSDNPFKKDDYVMWNGTVDTDSYKVGGVYKVRKVTHTSIKTYKDSKGSTTNGHHFRWFKLATKAESVFWGEF